MLTESAASLLEVPTVIMRAMEILGEAGSASRAATARSSFRALRPAIYYGEEIGMQAIKGHGNPYWDEYLRAPMRWDSDGRQPGTTRWLPETAGQAQPLAGISVAEQKGNPLLLFEYYRQLISLRKTFASLRTGATVFVERHPESRTLVYLRCDDDSGFLVALNLKGEPQEIGFDLERTLTKCGGNQ